MSKFQLNPYTVALILHEFVLIAGSNLAEVKPRKILELEENGGIYQADLQNLGYGPSGESMRLLEFSNRTNRRDTTPCDPSTNVYPCGALEFLGCSGNKKFFSQSTIRLNWFEAWEFCRSNGLHLASIQSNYEQSFLELFLPKPERGAAEGYWISGTDFGREGRFFWMNSGHPFAFTNWRKGEPNNYAGLEHCVQIISTAGPNQDNMMWNDFPCNIVAYAICQEDYARDI